jgi:hypothetical protein
MKDWKPIFLGARRSLIHLAVVALLCIGIVIGLHMLARSLNAEVLELGRSVQAQRAELNQRQEDLRNMRGNIARFEALRVQNLIGTPDRPMWVEELLASHSRLGVTTPLVYQLQVPRTLATADTQPSADATPPADGTSEEPLVHDLQFELRDVHEVDVLRLIQDFRSHVKGRFRVNACTFSDPRTAGMTAKCVLRFVTIPKAPASQPAQ